MVQRVLKRPEHRAHGFILHVTADVSPGYLTSMKSIAARSMSAVCVIRSGKIAYLSASDIMILFSTFNWITSWGHEGWEFVVSLSGADYPLANASAFRKALVRSRNKTWASPTTNIPMGSHTHRFTHYRMPWSVDKSSPCVPWLRGLKRRPWLFDLHPNIKFSKSIPLASGGKLVTI